MNVFRSKKNLSILALFLGAGFVLGTFVSDHFWKLRANKVAAQALPIRTGASTDYKLINPLLGYDTAKATDFGEYEDLQNQLEKKVKAELGNSDLQKFSIYFRDLPRGRWLGVNEDEHYTPASLLKVPVMMEYFKLSETDPTILTKQIKAVITSDPKKLELIPKDQRIEADKLYTVDQLIYYMIVYSDNDALEMLYDNVGDETMNEFFASFGVLLPEVSGAEQDFLSPKTYGLFFRVLYGSTFLNRADSEKALELLAKVTYKDGLVANLPPEITTAHKFGEFESTDSSQPTVHEFHDCGIVYYPNHPYLVCIMTKGGDIGNLQRIIRETSQIIYQGVQQTYR